MSIEQEEVDLSRVRIPPELNANLDEFFSTLKLRLLKKAIGRVSSRTNKDEFGVLQTEDLSAIAQEVFAEAPSELRNALSPCESDHVRRAS